jgi:hypothetical protein
VAELVAAVTGDNASLEPCGIAELAEDGCLRAAQCVAIGVDQAQNIAPIFAHHPVMIDGAPEPLVKSQQLLLTVHPGLYHITHDGFYAGAVHSSAGDHFGMNQRFAPRQRRQQCYCQSQRDANPADQHESKVAHRF